MKISKLKKMELIRYVTASPISTKAHLYRIHGKGPRERNTASEKINRLDKYLNRIYRLVNLAENTKSPETLYHICVKAETLAQKIHDLHLHGKVKKHAYKKLSRVEDRLSDLINAVTGSDTLDSSSTDLSDTQSSDSDSTIKYHITLEEIPDEDGI